MASKLFSELILEILQYASYGDSERRTSGYADWLHPDHTGLLNYARVCRAWAPHAQTLLFRHVVLTSNTQFASFQDALFRNRLTHLGASMKSASKPRPEATCTAAPVLRLSDAVRILQVCISDRALPPQRAGLPHPVASSSSSVEGLYDVAELLTRCSNLRELRVYYGPPRTGVAASITGLVAPHTDSLAEILSSFHAPLRTLRVIARSKDNRPLFDLLSHLPPMDTLSIESYLSQLPKSTNFLRKVRELTFGGNKVLLQKVLQVSKDSLRIVNFGITPGSNLASTINIPNPNLRSIGLKSPTADDGRTVQAVQRCVGLEELKCRWVPSRELVDVLPNRLEHLEFQGHNQPVHHIADFVSRAPSLRVVTWNECATVLNRPGSIRLVDACRVRGVELRCFQDALSWEEDLQYRTRVWPNRFPRPVELPYFRQAARHNLLQAVAA